MIIDLHFHTKEFSNCSKINLEEGIKKAKAIGLDGICITEHDVFPNYKNLEELQNKYNIKIFVGTEILTNDGDILCFGLDKLPNNDISAQELVDYVEDINGATIAAHPYRKNNRGIGDKIIKIKNLTAVEAFNGNTCEFNNRRVLSLSKKYLFNITGSSDAHFLDYIGIYATKFNQNITSIENLINALKEGNYYPVHFNRNKKIFLQIN